MPASIRTAGARLTVSKLSVLSGTLRPLRAMKVMDGDALRIVATFAGVLSAIAVPGVVTGFDRDRKPSAVTSSLVTATPTGGLGPYTYAWSIVSGDTRITPSNPSTASTAFRAIVFGEAIQAVAQCFVTDAYGSTATCDVTVILTQENSEYGDVSRL